nr:hypothetical protein FNV92_26370 [Bradyrhizobium cosmicum]
MQTLPPLVIASEAKQSRVHPRKPLDCFVASLLAMTAIVAPPCLELPPPTPARRTSRACRSPNPSAPGTRHR